MFYTFLYSVPAFSELPILPALLFQQLRDMKCLQSSNIQQPLQITTYHQ